MFNIYLPILSDRNGAYTRTCIWVILRSWESSLTVRLWNPRRRKTQPGTRHCDMHACWTRWKFREQRSYPPSSLNVCVRVTKTHKAFVTKRRRYLGGPRREQRVSWFSNNVDSTVDDWRIHSCRRLSVAVALSIPKKTKRTRPVGRREGKKSRTRRTYEIGSGSRRRRRRGIGEHFSEIQHDKAVTIFFFFQTHISHTNNVSSVGRYTQRNRLVRNTRAR